MRIPLVCILVLVLGIGVATAQPLDQKQPGTVPAANLLENVTGGADGGSGTGLTKVLGGLASGGSKKSGILKKLTGLIGGGSGSGPKGSSRAPGAGATSDSRQPTPGTATYASRGIKVRPIAVLAAAIVVALAVHF